ncbi:MAG: C4-type zinc ribbon domain-containing protein [Cyclobacteriaceae bacterium]|nr:C4-type zinc ribbon domain-containing protein [Cyclobacteriaceae bacterium]
MENTVAQKLDALSDLQELDSKLDDIKKIRGALPDEVRDLEDEIIGYQTRIVKYNKEIEDQNELISNNRNSIAESKKLIKKYEEQQMNVRNNREYDAITKEMELQSLEIQICEKRIREAEVKIEAKKLEIADTEVIQTERNKDLDSKKRELIMITSESVDEENKLKERRQKAATKVEDRLLNSYNKIRGNARNGLAVVSIKRDACGGCFNMVPPQRQAEVRERKKIIVCEHCGRIFTDIEEKIVPVVEPKVARKSTR